MDEIRTKKMEVVGRLLDSAVGLLFAGGDLVAVHSLAGTASQMLADLEPAPSAQPFADHPGAAKYREVARAAGTFVGQANIDPDVTRDLNPTDTASLVTAAILSFDERGGPISIAQSLFHIWYLACFFERLEESFPHREMVRAEFGNLSRRTWQYQIAMGRVALEKANANASAA